MEQLAQQKHPGIVGQTRPRAVLRVRPIRLTSIEGLVGFVFIQTRSEMWQREYQRTDPKYKSAAAQPSQRGLCPLPPMYVTGSSNSTLENSYMAPMMPVLTLNLQAGQNASPGW